MHLWNLYEVPAYESGLINTLNPRVGLGSLVDPTITQHQQQQLQTNNQNRIETSLSSSQQSSSSSSFQPSSSSSQQSSTSQSFVPSSPFQSKSRIRSFSHNVSHTNHHHNHHYQHHTTPLFPSSSSVSEQQSHSLNHLHSTASLLSSSSSAVKVSSKIPYHDNYNHNNYNQNLQSIFPSLPHLPLKQHQQLSGQLQPKLHPLFINRLVIQFMFSFVDID